MVRKLDEEKNGVELIGIFRDVQNLQICYTIPGGTQNSCSLENLLYFQELPLEWHSIRGHVARPEDQMQFLEHSRMSTS